MQLTRMLCQSASPEIRNGSHDGALSPSPSHETTQRVGVLRNGDGFEAVTSFDSYLYLQAQDVGEHSGVFASGYVPFAF